MDQAIIEAYLSGLSAQQVANKLGIGISKVYKTLRRRQVPRRTSWDTNRLAFEKSSLSFSIPRTLSREQEKLKYLALGLYWGEGAKTGQMLDIANSDPKVIKLFLKYLRETLYVQESKLRVYLYCFDTQDVNQLIRFWSQELQIYRIQFTKPYIKKTHQRLRRVCEYGTAHLRYHDVRLLKYILNEISLVWEKLWAEVDSNHRRPKAKAFTVPPS